MAKLKPVLSGTGDQLVDPAIADQVVTRNGQDRERIRQAAIAHNQQIEAAKAQRVYQKGVSKKERQRRKRFVKDAQAAAGRIKVDNPDMDNIGKRAEVIGGKLEDYLGKDQ